MRRGGTGGRAVLGMYDRPETRAATDALWARLAEAIRERGVDAPESLDRTTPLARAWTAPDLVLGQACGLPYARALRGRVGLIGAPAHALEGCPPGWYRSVLIVSVASPIAGPCDLRGARPAINSRDSQSGYAALMEAAAGLAREGRVFARPVITGGHGASIAAVAAGRADVAAIDAVSWALAQRHDAEAARVRVIGRTRPAPGLPYITAQTGHAAALAAAAAEAIAALPAVHRDALLLTGFAPLAPAAYQPLADRLAAAEAAHSLPG